MTFAYKMQGSCELTDADGDVLFENFSEESAGGGAAAMGTSSVIGGTGKYVGVTGEFSYEGHFYASPVKGVFQGSGTKNGSWQKATN